MTKSNSKSVDIKSVYSEVPRNKVLTVKMSKNELAYVAQIARGAGDTISSFTRKALSAYIAQA